MYVVFVSSANADEEDIRCMAHSAGWRWLSDGNRDHRVVFERPIARVYFESKPVAISFATQCAAARIKIRLRAVQKNSN
jgi:hypothetical protein